MSRVMPSQGPLDDIDPKPLLVISVGENFILDLEYLPDGRHIATTSPNSGTLRVWDLEHSKEQGQEMKHDGVRNLVETRDGTKIISIGGDRIKVWDTGSHTLLNEWALEVGACNPSLAISQDGQLVGVGGLTVVIYTMEGKRVSSIKVNKVVRSISFSPEGDKIACATSGWCDPEIRIHDIKTGAPVIDPLEGHRNSIDHVFWAGNGSCRLFSASSDKTIRCWNSETGQPIGVPWRIPTLNSLSLSPDGSILASASEDRTVRLWDATSGHPIGKPLEHSMPVVAVCFSPSGELVASTGSDGRNIYLWRACCSSSVEREARDNCLDEPHDIAGGEEGPTLYPSSTYIFDVSNPGSEIDLNHTVVRPADDATLSSNSHLIFNHVQDENRDKPMLLASSSTSDVLDLRSIILDTSLELGERQCKFELALHKLVDLANTKGLHVPCNFFPAANTLRTSLDTGYTPVSYLNLSTSLFRFTTNKDPRKVRKNRKIDKIKHKLSDMLCEIGFKLPRDRLPWSKLEGELQKKGYAIANWPEGVVRERDKGVYSLSAEDAEKLYRSLFSDERRLQFVRHSVESAESNITETSPAGDFELDGFHAIDGLTALTTPKSPRFRMTTSETYAERLRKKRRISS